MKINRTTLKNLRQALNSAVKDVADEFEVSIQFGNATFTPNGTDATFKVEVLAKMADGSVFNPLEEDFKKYAFMYGLSAEDFGKEFSTWDGNTYKICGLKRRAHKYPILAKDKRNGKTFKFPANTVKRSLEVDKV